MKRIILLFLITLLCSCSPKYFQNFDAVEYYRLTVDESKVDQNDNSVIEKILHYDLPQKIEDSLFYNELNTNLFSKQLIKSNDFGNLESCFTNKLSLIKTDYACIPTFRDIFVFKNKNKKVGIAKICFECEKVQFLESNADNEANDFNNFESLKAFLKNYNKQNPQKGIN